MSAVKYQEKSEFRLKIWEENFMPLFFIYFISLRDSKQTQNWTEDK